MSEIEALEALSVKEQLFVDEYFLDPKANGSAAAIRAGYSAKSARQQASRMLTKANIQAAIQEKLDESAMQADEVLRRLTDQARGSMRDFMTLDADGLPVPDWRMAKRLGLLHLVKSFTRASETKTIGRGENAVEIVTVTVKTELYDAQAALNLLGKHHKLFDRALEGDWQREMKDAGLNPEEELERLATDFFARLKAGVVVADGGGDDGSAASA